MTGSSSPSDWRIWARSAAEVSCETIWLTGSPAKRNIANEMIPTAIITPTAWIKRRRVKASIWSFRFPSEGARGEREPEIKSPGSQRHSGGLEEATRNLEIPGCAIAHPRFVAVRRPRNDEGYRDFQTATAYSFLVAQYSST